MALRRTPRIGCAALRPQWRRPRRRARAGSGYLADGRRNGHCSARALGIRRNQ